MSTSTPSAGYRHFICAAATFVYVLSFPAQEYLLGRWGELWVVLARCGFGALTLLAMVPMLDGIMALKRAPWRALLTLGAVGVGGCATLLIFAQSLSDPVITTVLICAVPAMSALWSLLADGENLSPAQWFGVALALTGGVVASDVMGRDLGHFRGGELLVLLSNLLFIWFSRQSNRIPNVSSSISATICMVGATLTGMIGLGLGLVMGWQMWTHVPEQILLWDGVAALQAGMLALGFGMALWMYSVKIAGITTAGAHLNMMPFYLMLIMTALGQDFSNIQAIGGAIVVLGAILTQRPPARVPVDTPRIDTPRIDTPRIDTTRIDTGRIKVGRADVI